MNNGWLRVWVVFTGILLFFAILASVHFYWTTDTCYRLKDIYILNEDIYMRADKEASIFENEKVEKLDAAKKLKNTEMHKTHCGNPLALMELSLGTNYGPIFSFNVEWLNLSSWIPNSDTFGYLKSDINDIGKVDVFDEYHEFNVKTKLREGLIYISVAIAISIVVMLLGFSIGWARRGFINDPK